MTVRAGEILAAVKANRAKLDACPRHHFIERTPFGEPWVCTRCGGGMRAGDVLAYCAGYQAAGGDPARDVWAPWARQ